MAVLRGYYDSGGPASAGASPGRAVHHPISKHTNRIQNRIQTAVMRRLSLILHAECKWQIATSGDIGRLALSGGYKRTLIASSVIILTLDDSGSGSGAYPQPQRPVLHDTSRNRARLDRAPPDHICCSTGRLCSPRVAIRLCKYSSLPMREPRHKTACYLGCPRSTTKQILLLSCCRPREQK